MAQFSKRYLVLGTGVGKAIAYALLKSSESAHVTIADLEIARAKKVRKEILDILGRRADCKAISFLSDFQGAIRIFKGYDVVISALPARLNLVLAEAALTVGTNFCDLGGVTGVTRDMLCLNNKFRDPTVSIVPDCGLMPGMGIIMARKLIGEFEDPKSVVIYVGGLPQKPEPPMFYQRVFSVEGLKHICYDDAPVLEGGEVILKKPYSGYEVFRVEELEKFSAYFNGKVEAFTTAGASVAPWTFGKLGVSDFEEKTIRWPGFVDFVKNIPENDFEASVTPFIDTPIDRIYPDLVWMSVEARGFVGGLESVRNMRLLDLFDEKTGLTAMERTTGFPTAIIAEMLADNILKKGVHTPESALDMEAIDLFFKRLRAYLTVESC